MSSSSISSSSPTPITIVTGFLGSGKTTVILNLVPQLRAANAAYRLALLKNEFGDVAVDSQLAASGAVSGVQELLNGCICCNLVGQLGPALTELRQTDRPDRIIVETSGSAFPATLAIEINRIARETGAFTLDGVISVIDVENWRGYEDTSYTAKIQARYTDLIVFNKWEACGDRRFDECLDRVGDLELEMAWVKSEKGWVSMDVVFGIDGELVRTLTEDDREHDHGHNHQSEVEVLSIQLVGPRDAGVRAEALHDFLKRAPKDEVYRIKAVLTTSATVPNSDNDGTCTPSSPSSRCILNWAFGRWTFTPLLQENKEHQSSAETALRMTMILARCESTKWKKKLEAGGLLELVGDDKGQLTVSKIA